MDNYGETKKKLRTEIFFLLARLPQPKGFQKPLDIFNIPIFITVSRVVHEDYS